MFENILVVCIGNICRSPIAEALLKEALQAQGKTTHVISSAGLGAMVGHKPDAIGIELMREQGIDISDYRATQINQEMIRKADLILVMESRHQTLIETQEPSAKGKVFRLGEWGGFDIADPYRQERKVFEKIMCLIEKGVADWAKKI